MTDRAGEAGTPRWRAFLGSVIIAASGVIYPATSVWITNSAVISSPLRLVQLIALEVVVCAAVLAFVAMRGWNLTVTASTLAIGGLLFGSGDAVSRRLGSFGAWILFVAGVTTCAVLLHRVAQSSNRLLPSLALGLSLFFLLQSLMSIDFEPGESPARITASAPLPVTNTGLGEDFFFVVLDGYASITTLRDQFAFDSPIRDVLIKEGFEVVDSAWSPSTRSMIAISSLLNIGVPLVDSGGLTEADIEALLTMIRGDARLFSMFQAGDYVLTYVESGWVGSVCGEGPDVCIRRPFIDEAIQVVVDKSLLGDASESRWVHAFARGGLHSLSEVERTVREFSANGINDMVFAHVMLPHAPYVLGSDCQVTGTPVPEPTQEQIADGHAEIAKAAYLTQMRCIDSWLQDIVASFPESSAMVITGDHGTAFRGQMSREAATWSADDIAERTQTFLALRLPAACSRTTTVSGTLEAMMDVSDCLLGTRLDRSATETLWLLGAQGSPRCIMKPDQELVIRDVPC